MEEERETKEKSRECPDCGGSMNEIRLIDKDRSRGQSVDHHALEYAAPDAEIGFWTGRYPVEGEIDAFLCQDCGRVLLYGRKKAPYKPDPDPEEW